MSGFGAFCPMPLRLGGSQTEGWTAQQHARVVADRTALVRASHFAWLTFTLSAGVITRHSYNGMPGNGLAFAPTGVVIGTGHTQWTWPASQADSYEVLEPVALRQAKVSPHGTTALIGTAVVAAGRNVVDVYTFDNTGAAANCKATLRVA
jgi:hypothetical protein